MRPFWMGAHEVTWDEYDKFWLDENVPPGLDGGRDQGRRRGRPHPADAALRRRVVRLRQGQAAGHQRDAPRGDGVLALALAADGQGLPPAHRGRVGVRLPRRHHDRLLVRRRPGRARRARLVSPTTPRTSRSRWGAQGANPWGLYDMHGNVGGVGARPVRQGRATRPAPAGAVGPVRAARPSSVSPTSRAAGRGTTTRAALRCAARLASSPEWIRRDPQRPQSIWWLTDATFVGFRVVRALEEQKELVGLRSRVTKESP